MTCDYRATNEIVGFSDFALVVLDNANLEEIWNVSAHVKLELPRRRMMFTLNPKLCYRKIAEFVESGVVLAHACNDGYGGADSDGASAAASNRSSPTTAATAAAAVGEKSAPWPRQRAGGSKAKEKEARSGTNSGTGSGSSSGSCQIGRDDRDNWQRNNGNSLCNVRTLHLTATGVEATQVTIKWSSDDSGTTREGRTFKGITMDPNVQRHIISLVIYYREAPSQDLTIFRCDCAARTHSALIMHPLFTRFASIPAP